MENKTKKLLCICGAACTAGIIILLWNLVSFSAAAKSFGRTQAAAAKMKSALDDSVSLEVFDESTGLYNIDSFFQIVDKQRRNADRRSALIYISFKSVRLGHDLKYINDTYGHICGNRMVKDFAADLKKAYPGSRYVLGHRGGSGFIVLDTDFRSYEDSLENIMTLKKIWHDVPWTYDSVVLDSPALNAVVYPVSAQDDLKKTQDLLYGSSESIYNKSLFEYLFLKENAE